MAMRFRAGQYGGNCSDSGAALQDSHVSDHRVTTCSFRVHFSAGRRCKPVLAQHVGTRLPHQPSFTTSAKAHSKHGDTCKDVPIQLQPRPKADSRTFDWSRQRTQRHRRGTATWGQKAASVWPSVGVEAAGSGLDSKGRTALLQLCAAGRRRGSMPAAPHGKPAGQGHGQREGQDQGQAGSWEDAARGLTVPEQLAAAARLLDSGVSPNVANRDGRTALHKATYSGHHDMVQLLLRRGAAVNVQDKTGDTPLHNACAAGHLGMAEALLEAGADPNVANQEGQTALRLASAKGCLSLVELLLLVGAQVNAHTGGEVPTALHDACEPSDPDAGPRRRAAQAEGRARVALRLLAAGANPNARDQFGRTPLFSASYVGREDVVRALLRAGAAVDCTDKYGQMPLKWAGTLEDRPAAVALLLGAGAHVNHADERGFTALHWAANKGCLEVVRALLAAGADVGARTKEGHTALDLASRRLAFEATRPANALATLGPEDEAKGRKLEEVARLLQQHAQGKGSA